MTELFDFEDGNGPVPAHRHENGGGRVSDTAYVSENAWVSENARVYGNACVSGDARVSGVMRSDGYCFCAVPCADGKNRVIAGCRYFTFPEARAHWEKSRGSTKFVETFLILDYLEKMLEIRPCGV